MRIDTAILYAAAMLVAAVPFEADAQTRPAGVHLLDVPYLPQTEALCGGAAAAMVMRFWGTPGVYAETFSSLLNGDAGGIRGEDLVRALQDRGWRALTFKGDLVIVQSHLDKRRPLIALIEDRPGRFHYVVIVGAYNNRIVVHDPARAPFRVLDEAAFTRAWEASGFWTLLALPPEESKAQPALGESAPATASNSAEPCGAMVEEGVRLATGGDANAARRVLELAAASCPTSAAPWREMAGLHALRGEWRDAAADARTALRRNSRDEHAARILATSLFLDGEPLPALDAWNTTGEPRIDIVNIKGLERTRYAVAARALDLEPRELLTSGALRLAQRRLADLPSSLASRVAYRPGDNGLAHVDAAVVERPLVPAGVVPAAAVGVRALTDRELWIPIASPSGGGELWMASWRWWERRPRARLSFSAPAPGPLRGVWRVEVLGEKQTYGTSAATLVEHRRGAALHLADWITGQLRWSAAVGVDRWSDRSASILLAGGIEARVWADRVTTDARVSLLPADRPSWTVALGADSRSRTRNEGTVFLLRAGFEAASDDAPLAVWPGAGAGQGRDVLLRAHGLLRDGVIRDGVFGRSLAHGGGEWRRWLPPIARALRIAPAAYVDAARASHTLPGFDRRLHVDAGVGLRIAVPGAGVLRADVARGLRDQATAISFGWTK